MVCTKLNLNYFQTKDYTKRKKIHEDSYIEIFVFNWKVVFFYSK